VRLETVWRVVVCLPANAVASHVDDTFVRLGVQLWGLAHVDLMVFICEECWIRQGWLELGHYKYSTSSQILEAHEVRYGKEVQKASRK
jgi:hypothetical protein